MTDRNMKMPDLSKTIYQLKEEVKRADYIDIDYLDCVDVNVLKDALILLEAQEARVMTLEEVKAKPDYAWIEKLDSKKTYIVLFDFTAVLSDLSSYAHTWNHYGKDELLSLLLYNKTWRCWTSRPDDKRRAETPWE